MSWRLLTTTNVPSKDGNEYTVRLEKNGAVSTVFGPYLGDLNSGLPAFRLLYGEQNNDTWTPYRSALLEANFVSLSEAQAQALKAIATSGSRDYRLVFNREGSVMATGYCLPSVKARVSDKMGQVITVQAKDRIGSLQRIDFLEGGNKYKHRRTVMQLIATALDQLGHVNIIDGHINWYPYPMTSAGDPFSCTISPESFYDEDNDGNLLTKAFGEVLSEVCSSFGLEVIQWDGRWMVQQPQDFVSGASKVYSRYDRSGNPVGLFGNPAYPSVIDITSDKYIHRSDTVWSVDAFREAKFTYVSKQEFVRIANGGFEFWDETGNLPLFWTVQASPGNFRRVDSFGGGNYAFALSQTSLGAADSTTVTDADYANAATKFVKQEIDLSGPNVLDFRVEGRFKVHRLSGSGHSIRGFIGIKAVNQNLWWNGTDWISGTQAERLIPLGNLDPMFPQRFTEDVILPDQDDTFELHLYEPVVRIFSGELGNYEMHWDDINARVLSDLSRRVFAHEVTDQLQVDFSGDASSLHDFGEDDEVQFFTTDRLPEGLEEDETYFIINPSPPFFQVSETEGGSAVDIIDKGIGKHWVRVLKKADTSTRSYIAIDEDNEDGLSFELQTTFGSGPFASATRALRKPDGDSAEGWQVGPYSGGVSSEHPLHELAAIEYMRGHRSARREISLTLVEGKSYTPIKAYELDGTRYWPTYWEMQQPTGHVRVVLREIRDDGIVDTSELESRGTGAQAFTGSDAVVAITSLDDKITNLFTSIAATSTDEVISKSSSITSIPIHPVDSIFKANDKIQLVEVRTKTIYNLTVASDYPRFGDSISVDSFSSDIAIDAGSYVVIDPKDALTRLVVTENGLKASTQLGNLCRIQGAIKGEAKTSLSVSPLRATVRAGFTFMIPAAFSDTSQNTPVVVSSDTEAGATTLPIQSQWIECDDDAPLIPDAMTFMAMLWIQPDQIQLSVEREREGYSLTNLTNSLDPGNPVTSISVNALPTAVKDNDFLKLTNKRTGKTFDLTVDGDHAASATSITIDPFNPDEFVAIGSAVRLSDEMLRSSITLNADNINLRVEKNDVINQINISTEGIVIAGENIELNGDTTVDGTFSVTTGGVAGWTIESTRIVSSFIELVSGASARVRVGDNAAGNAAGLAAGSAAGDTLIWAGGSYANRATAPFRVTAAGATTASNATVTGNITATSGSLSGLTVAGTLTMGASGLITNSGGNYAIDDEGIEFTLPSESVDAAAMIRWGGLATSTPRVAAFDDLTHGKVLQLGGDATDLASIKIFMVNIPSSDPGVSGQLWNDSGTLKVST